MLVLYCRCRTLHTSPKSEPCTFGFPSVGSSAFASCSLEHLDHIVVFPYHSRVHHHLCCSRTFFFKSWEVLKFRFFRHIHAYMSFRYRISLSVSTVHTYLKFTLDIYLIPYPFLTATHTHKKKRKAPLHRRQHLERCDSCVCWRAGANGLAVVGSYLEWEYHPIWRVQLWIRKLINQFPSVFKWLGSWTNPPSDKIEISLTPDQ